MFSPDKLKKIFTSFGKFLFSVYILFNLNYCATEIGNPEGEEELNTISGIAAKGPINLATVSVYKLNNDGTRGDFIADTKTSSDGSYSIAVSYSGAVELAVTGGSYTDEATGSTVDLLSGDEIKILLASVSASTSAAITPLTTIAAAHASKNASQGLSTAISNANNAVAYAFGLSGIDITTQKPSDLTSDSSTDDEEPAKKYGSILAGLSRVAMEKGLSASEVLNLVKAMAEDFQDGIFDEKNAAGEVLTITGEINPVQAYQDLNQAILNFLESPENKSGYASSDFNSNKILIKLGFQKGDTQK